MIKSKMPKKNNPSLLLAMSFLFVIVLGTILLSLPISYHGEKLNIIDALFTSTTSTCVTGLMVANAVDFSLFGQIVILFLIQIGGLGLMTFVAVIIMHFGNQLELKGRDLMKEALNKENYEDIGKYIKAIIKYTLTFETLGFLVILTQIYNGSLYSIFQSVFLSVSAFCNAGIDVLGTTSLLAYQNNVVINVMVSMLIIFGGIGFAVWFDVYNNIKKRRHLKAKYSVFDRLSVSSRIVIIVTTLLILSGTIFILITEWNGVLKDCNIFEKVLQASFNSITLRTAGFSTFDYSALSSPTKIIMCLFMLVGASPGGTGGGMKTTTFFLLIVTVLQELQGISNFHVFNHHIPKKTITKALTIMLLYVSTLIMAMILLTGSEENINSIDLLFEAVSAIGTVGLSTGITTVLNYFSRVIIIILMFVGRLGPITIALMLKTNKGSSSKINYPKTDLLLG